jgi:hypothetical protein
MGKSDLLRTHARISNFGLRSDEFNLLAGPVCDGVSEAEKKMKSKLLAAYGDGFTSDEHLGFTSTPTKQNYGYRELQTWKDSTGRSSISCVKSVSLTFLYYGKLGRFKISAVHEHLNEFLGLVPGNFLRASEALKKSYLERATLWAIDARFLAYQRRRKDPETSKIHMETMAWPLIPRQIWKGKFRTTLPFIDLEGLHDSEKFDYCYELEKSMIDDEKLLFRLPPGDPRLGKGLDNFFSGRSEDCDFPPLESCVFFVKPLIECPNVLRFALFHQIDSLMNNCEDYIWPPDMPKAIKKIHEFCKNEGIYPRHFSQ